MTEPENGTYPASSASLLHDEESQLLALSDSLARANGPAICRAFAEVAHARGMSQIASIAGVSQVSLRAALADKERPDIGLLGKVVEALSRDGSEHAPANQSPDRKKSRFSKNWKN